MEDDEVDFLFDFVVTKVDLLKPVKELDKLDAAIRIAGNLLTITNSRINVPEFENNRQFPFSMTPADLRTTLAEDGLTVAVRYNKASVGNALILFPDTFTDKISPTMNDLLYEDTAELTRKGGESVGTVSILMVLIVKCAEPDQGPRERRSSARRRSSRKSTASLGSSTVLHLSPPKKEVKVECVGLGPTINPLDVIFVIGDPDPLLKIPSDPCSELRSEEGEERLRLDLMRYNSLDNRRVSFPEDDPCPREKPSFTQLKKLTEQYSQLIDEVAEKVKSMGLPTTDTPSEKTKVTPRKPKEVPDERWIPVPLGSEEEDYGVKPIRFCPVCLCSMSWLPRLASCPRCHCRPRPVLRAGHPAVTQKLTADEIVAELLTRPKAPPEAEDFCLSPCEAAFKKAKKERKKPMVDSDSDAECPPCRCTCSGGKPCAHCRIRLLCADIFEAEDKPEERQEERPKVVAPQPRSSEDFCVIPDSEDEDRPYLARVFKELKSLYALHDTRKLAAIRKRCESQTLLTLKGRRSSNELGQSQLAGFNAHLPGSFERQKAGHKHCLPTEISVPRRHGWDWPRSLEARKHGWRPGTILRAAEQVMRFFLSSRTERDPCSKIVADQEALQRKRSPILNICKRDGDIFVTLRGKDTPGLRQKPITFRIVKSELAVALRQIKRALKDQGFVKCTEHHTLMLCTCRNALEKFELNKALRKECRRRLMEPCPEKLVLTDTSISDLEFDLDIDPLPTRCSPELPAIRNTVNHGTQTLTDDEIAEIPQKYPLADSPYWRAFDCAAGERYMGTAFGDNLETVFEDGIFGYRDGGQHGRATFWKDPRVWNEGGGAPLRMGTARNAIDPHRFGKSVWKGVPRKILRKMIAKSKH